MFSLRLTSLPRAKTPRKTFAPTSTILGATPEYLARRYVSQKKMTRPINKIFFLPGDRRAPFPDGVQRDARAEGGRQRRQGGRGGRKLMVQTGYSSCFLSPKKRFAKTLYFTILSDGPATNSVVQAATTVTSDDFYI